MTPPPQANISGASNEASLAKAGNRLSNRSEAQARFLGSTPRFPVNLHHLRAASLISERDEVCSSMSYESLFGCFVVNSLRVWAVDRAQCPAATLNHK